MSNERANLLKKLGGIRANLNKLVDDKQHAQGWAYPSAEQIYSNFRKQLVEHEVDFSANPVKWTESEGRVFIEYDMIFSDPDSGESITEHWFQDAHNELGQGKRDSFAIQKAHTYAIKQFVRARFQMSDKDEPDADTNINANAMADLFFDHAAGFCGTSIAEIKNALKNAGFTSYNFEKEGEYITALKGTFLVNRPTEQKPAKQEAKPDNVRQMPPPPNVTPMPQPSQNGSEAPAEEEPTNPGHIETTFEDAPQAFKDKVIAMSKEFDEAGYDYQSTVDGLIAKDLHKLYNSEKEEEILADIRKLFTMGKFKEDVEALIGDFNKARETWSAKELKVVGYESIETEAQREKLLKVLTEQIEADMQSKFLEENGKLDEEEEIVEQVEDELPFEEPVEDEFQPFDYS